MPEARRACAAHSDRDPEAHWRTTGLSGSRVDACAVSSAIGMWRTPPGIRPASHSCGSRTSTIWTSPASKRRRASSAVSSMSLTLTRRSLGRLLEHEPPGEAVQLLGAARQLLGGGDDLLRRGDGLVAGRRDLLGGGRGLLGDGGDLA